MESIKKAIGTAEFGDNQSRKYTKGEVHKKAAVMKMI